MQLILFAGTFKIDDSYSIRDAYFFNIYFENVVRFLSDAAPLQQSTRWNFIMGRGSVQTERPPRFCAFFCLGFLQVHWQRNAEYWLVRLKKVVHDFPARKLENLRTSSEAHFKQVQQFARRRAMQNCLSTLGLKLDDEPVLGDGSCLFRALARSFLAARDEGWMNMKIVICQFLNDNAVAYAPYIGDGEEEFGYEVDSSDRDVISIMRRYTQSLLSS